MSVVNETKDFSSRKLRDGIIKSRGTRAGDMVIAIICFVMMILCLLPMLHVLACSLSSADALVKNEVFIIPKGWNIEAYRTVLTTPKYVRSLGWTAILTVMCTLLSISLTICCSYPLIYSELKGGKFINFIILFTMYFSAGTIPSYLLLSRLGMLNTPYALIFLATLSLFYAVGRWNGFSDALMYLKKSESEPYWPIQLLLYNVIKNSTQTNEQAAQEGFFANGVSKTIQMATVMFATVPILVVYPWLQRYFVTGVTIGAVKG